MFSFFFSWYENMNGSSYFMLEKPFENICLKFLFLFWLNLIYFWAESMSLSGSYSFECQVFNFITQMCNHDFDSLCEQLWFDA